MTINWQDIRPVLFAWMVAMTCIAAFFAFSTIGCGAAQCATRTYEGINLLGLGAILITSLVAVYGFMKASPQLLFTPLVAYAGACALFYGFGPMSNFIANDTTLAYQAQSVYAISAEESLRTNLLTSVGIAISLLTVYFALPQRNRTFPPMPKMALGSVAILFVSLGLVLKHLIIMPSVYGTSSFVVPGILQNLRYLPDLGFALMAMLAAKGDRRWATAFWLIWPLHFMLAFPEFSKRSVMLTMLLPAIGSYIGHRSMRRLMFWVVPAILIYTVLQNTNTIARAEEQQAENEFIVLGVSDRLSILRDVIVEGDAAQGYLPPRLLGVQQWWLRLNFSGPQNAAMELRDSGVEAGFTQNPLVYWVPRFLWPDKPPIIGPGELFHGIVTQNPSTETKIGITVFADGYWQFGWFGVALFSAIMGLIFAVITRMTMNQLSRHLYLYLPAAALGIQMGATSSGSFLQVGFLSALSVYFGYCLVVYLIYGQLGQLRHRSRERNRDIAYGTA